MNETLLWVKKMFFIVTPIFLIHFAIFQIPSLKSALENFEYSFLYLYVLFFVFSQLTILIIHIVSKKSFESTGFAFLGILTIKLICYFLMLQTLLHKDGVTVVEKSNFVFLMVLFTVIDIVLTSQILSKKS
jgi:hypothetical protein